ncbi:MAG: hypothetical protein VKN13_05320 [Cyanobacteriota bacterium]|nr:hypothetical protein [Cyanobacteriota bacterium]
MNRFNDQVEMSCPSDDDLKVDLEFCRLSYDLGIDISDDDIMQLIRDLRRDPHWIASPAEYAVKTIPKADPIFDRIYNFNWREYQQANADLSELTPKQLVEHYHRHGLVEARSLCSNHEVIDRRLSICSNPPIANRGRLLMDTKIRVVVHCYYYSLLPILEPSLRLLTRLGATIHIYVTNDEVRSEQMDAFLHGLNTGTTMAHGQHHWKRSINYYEDWPTFHQAYHEGLFDSAGITFKFQTKKSSRLAGDGGRLWTEELVQAVAGSYDSVYTVCDSIVRRGYGMAGSIMHKKSGLGVNPELVKEIANRVGLNPRRIEQDSFVAGSMFAVDNDMARAFYSSLGDLDYSQPPSGGNEHCGRYYGHAIERCMGYFCEQRSQGIRWLF